MIEFIILFIIIIFIYILINTNGYLLLDYFNSILKLEKNDPIIYTRSRGLINLKHNYNIIKNEYLQYQNNHKIPIFGEITNDQNYLSNDQIDTKWRVVILRMYNKDTNLCKYFPNTMKLLDLIPNISLIMFSILEPKKKIMPHRGVYHGVLRYHLGLITPLHQT
jgi:beta-hydroxylase